MPFPMSARRVATLALCPLAAGAVALSVTTPAVAAPSPAASSAASSAASTVQGLTTTVTGTIGTDPTVLTGTMTITHFVRSAAKNQILAVGNLTLGDQNLGTFQAPVTVTDPPASCAILHLDLGPLDLNLLGLVVHLNEVVLDITAVPGAGNLLGNLLCAVTGLLDNTGGLNGALGAITALLNQILAAL